MKFSNDRGFDDSDLEYMSSLSTAANRNTAQSSRIFLWSVLALVSGTLIWMSIAEVDEITKGEGKVIPSTHLQVIQNLEGGIVEEIHVNEGDSVKKGDLLIRLSDIKPKSEFDGNRIQYYELKSKLYRLQAEASMGNFSIDPPQRQELDGFIEREEGVFHSNRSLLISKINILNEQMNQRLSELSDAKSKAKLLSETREMIAKEEALSQSMFQKGVESKSDYWKVQRERSRIERELEEAQNSIPRLEYAVAELKEKMLQEKIDYQNKAKLELSATNAELGRIDTSSMPLSDQVDRSKIIAPVTGVMKQMFINTVGGVVRPGMDIAEIVPTEDSLLIETKIKPSDIGFLHPGQKAIVKFSAYDFSIYGGMVGEVYQISSDTIIDQQKQESYYLVKVKINQKLAINSKLAKVTIMPGMTANIDILTGKKTILQYLMKPIIKARQNALTEK
ncbi:MAG: HlyD family type I secretion periplasmic adaptor subunit [Sulfuricurvum sp.]|uniref:HlyD family type I secretion periplasmic adaptor subunit n=2 Tax=Sulfuricurvum sp. TaxID=2025608 RepID=UPI0027370640|nr:HlyD family type I secretion periplasmic adaptor subunit [Sulfuricurvum sp.]MDP2851767.1 HlyD family type I secretion periplasmic adaptor subunit [Sulfuricurvum sp.]